MLEPVQNTVQDMFQEKEKPIYTFDTFSLDKIFQV